MTTSAIDVRHSADRLSRPSRGGTGFDTHPHPDMEIMTWVLGGELEPNGRLDTSDAARLTHAGNLSLVADHGGVEVMICTTGALR